MSEDNRNRRDDEGVGQSPDDLNMLGGGREDGDASGRRAARAREAAEGGHPPRHGANGGAAESEHHSQRERGGEQSGHAGSGQAGTDRGEAGQAGTDQGEAGQSLPARAGRARRKQGTALPALRAPEPGAPAIRAERVEAIRRDLVRRRRRKGLGVLARLAIFVVLPTVVVAWFLWTKASDLYGTEAVFVVQSADAGASARSGSGGGFLAALSGGVTDAVAVQNFILSRDVLRRLETEFGILEHYRNPELDRFHRLAPDATFEEALEHYRRFTEVSFDPTEGVLTLTVIASEPEYAQRIAVAVIGYSEEMVDTLSGPIRQNALLDADANLAEAEARLRDAQLAAADLRKSLETFSVEGEISSEMNIMTQLQIELEGLRARLTNLRRVTGEDDPRVQRLRDQVETLEAQVAARQEGMTGTGRGPSGLSLADVNAQLERANFEVTAAMALFTSAIEAREFARTEAARQHRYLSVVVQPALPDSPNYPKKAETTALAFLIFLGIYIMASLTISLIREQASI